MKKTIIISTLVAFFLGLSACEIFKAQDTSEGSELFIPKLPPEVTDSLDGTWVSQMNFPQKGQHRFSIKINSEENSFSLAKECVHERLKTFRAYAIVKVSAEIEDATKSSKGLITPEKGAKKETYKQQGQVKLNCFVEIKSTDIFRFDRRGKRMNTFYEETSSDNLNFFKISD